jgi:transcriptional regulator with XRE-family HTH domain
MTAGSGPRRKPGSPPPPDDPKAFAAVVGEVVRRARQSRGWTQAQLAEFAGFSPNYIARLERGELGPSLFVASQLCEALGIDVGSLVHPHPGTAPPRTTRRRIVG